MSGLRHVTFCHKVSSVIQIIPRYKEIYNVWSLLIASNLLIIIFFIHFQSGMQAVRENRYIILSKDFEKAYKKAIRKDDQEHDFYK